MATATRAVRWFAQGRDSSVIDPQTVYLFLVGAAGAACYAFPSYLQDRQAGSPNALWMFGYAVGVGFLFGGILTRFIGQRVPWTVDPEPYPLAFVLGLMANPLLPQLINRGRALFNALPLPTNGGRK